jgi:hypothetical protein
MTDTPPDWVLIEAAKRSDVTIYTMFSFRQGYAGTPASFRALCDMIWKYEQPPVDRKLLCAQKVFGEYGGYNIDLCVRAIELFLDEGFGRD